MSLIINLIKCNCQEIFIYTVVNFVSYGYFIKTNSYEYKKL